MAIGNARRVELGAIEVRPHGESFVLELRGADDEVQRVELPSWAVHQLMRALPRLDAAMAQAPDAGPSGLIAYPVVQWALAPTGADQGVALSLQTDRQVESAFLFAADDASALHAALDDALARAAFNAPAGRTAV